MMNRIILGFLAAIAVVLFYLPASATELYPRVDGNDVLVPDQLIKAIPGYSAEVVVYAATDLNGWFVRGNKFAAPEVMKATGMELEGEGEAAVWRAKGMKGRRFHPVQLDEGSKPKWAKIEEVYPLESDFVDNSGSGPCLLVK